MSLKSVIEGVPGYNKLVLPVHYAQALKAEMKYKRPAKKLRVIGVTGTNGKTTTCFMIWKMLLNAGYKVGLLTTVGWSENGEELHQQVEHMTTERVGVLNQRIRAVADAGAEFLVLEVTSHALAQYRTLGVPIEIAVFTNLTHEHLDYHGTFAKYREAKMKLFRHAKVGIVNADDQSYSFFAKAIATKGRKSRIADNRQISASEDVMLAHRMSNTARSASPSSLNSTHSERLNGSGSAYSACGDVITYGIQHGEVRARDVKLSASGIEYTCGEMRIKTRIPGEFNVYNSLAAVCVGKKIGLTDRQIEDGIYALEAVEGRMNRIEEGQEFTVIVDYAHTPDALEQVLSPLVGLASDGKDAKRIIAVHGGAGRRDESTRKIRGEILGKYSDIVIITEDDSRDEDPEKIAAEFVKGAEKFGKVQGKDLFVDLDRRSAIKRALDLAQKDDIVLILGKGHEKTILRADGAHEFEDIKVVKELLAK